MQVIEKKEFLSLTGLRFVAAFYLFVFHIHIRWPVTDLPYLKTIANQGAVGMSLFFMLSGFVLAYSYTDSNRTLKSYLVNRLARIYPVYVAAAVLTLPWMGISSADTGKMFAQGTLLVFSNVLLVQAWLPSLFPFWNNGASWSISVEAFCYVLVPLLLPLLVTQSRRRLYVLVAIFLLLGSLPGLTAAAFPNPLNAVFYSLPIFRLPEFMVGILILFIGRSGVSFRSLGFWLLPVLVLLLVYLGLAGEGMPFYIGHSWIVLPCMGLMLAGLSGGQGVLAWFLSTRLLVWLGKISYCFYSFQALLILSLISYRNALVAQLPALGNNLVLLVAALLVLVGLSALGYYGIEVPARRWIKRRYVH